jgi:multidrug resistance protein, MATE family
MALGVDRERAKTILALATPIVIAMFTQTFINVVDTIFVGKLDPSYSIPGQSALGYSLPIFWSIAGFLAAIGVGTQAMTARRYGEGSRLNAGVVLINSLVVAVIASLIFTVIGWVIIPPFFSFLTTNESVLSLGIPYAQLRILGVLAMVTTMSYKGFFDGIGMTRVHMYAALIMNAANICLNYIFIFGMGPIPAYYVTGAAIASLISTYIGLLVMAIWSMRRKYRSPHQYYRLANLRPKVAWEITRLSFPSGAAQLFVMSGVLLFLKVIGILDERAVMEAIQSASGYVAGNGLWDAQSVVRAAGHQPAMFASIDWTYAIYWSRPPIFQTASKLIIDIMSIGFVMCIAFGTATNTLVSRSMGESKLDLAEAYGWDSVKMGMVFFGIIGVLLIGFPTFFLDLLSDDATVIEAAVPGLRIMGSLEIFIAMALILTQALYGAGNTKFVMWVELVLHGVCLVPLAWLLAIHLELGFIGVWLSAAVYVTALASVMSWKFWQGSWKRIQV